MQGVVHSYFYNTCSTDKFNYFNHGSQKNVSFIVRQSPIYYILLLYIILLLLVLYIILVLYMLYERYTYNYYMKKMIFSNKIIFHYIEYQEKIFD